MLITREYYPVRIDEPDGLVQLDVEYALLNTILSSAISSIVGDVFEIST